MWSSTGYSTCASFQSSAGLANQHGQFDPEISQYPTPPASTRFRAVYLFSTFLRLRQIPSAASFKSRQKIARRLGVAALTLALKTDIDFNEPLFVVPIGQLTQMIGKGGWVAMTKLEVIVRNLLASVMLF